MVYIDHLLTILCGGKDSQRFVMDIDLNDWELEKLCFNVLQLPIYKKINNLLLEEIIYRIDIRCSDAIGKNGYRLLALYHLMVSEFPENKFMYLIHSTHFNSETFKNEYKKFTNRDVYDGY